MSGDSKDDLFLDRAVKLIEPLPTDIIRMITTMENLGSKTNEAAKALQQARQSISEEYKTERFNKIFAIDKSDPNYDSKKFENLSKLYLKWWEQLSQNETDIVSHNDEKLAVLDQSITNVDCMMKRLKKELKNFEATFNPNMVALESPNNNQETTLDHDDFLSSSHF